MRTPLMTLASFCLTSSLAVAAGTGDGATAASADRQPGDLGKVGRAHVPLTCDPAVPGHGRIAHPDGGVGLPSIPMSA